jgi:site-specific recombinase XerD
LAIGSGARFAELLRFTVDLIDENSTAFDGIFLETSKTIKTKGRTKAGKMLTKYIIKDLFWDHYQNWLPIREEILKKNNKDHPFVFVKNNGNPLEEGSVRGWVTKIEEFLGIPFYPHCLRHFTTTYLSKVGLPYTLIKDIFGWQDTLMCSIYDDNGAKDKEWKELGNLKESLKK